MILNIQYFYQRQSSSFFVFSYMEFFNLLDIFPVQEAVPQGEFQN